MASDKLIRLLNDLKNATAQGKIVWEDTSDENLFRLILANGIIQIGPEKERGGIVPKDWMAEPPYVVTLLNENDKAVEVLRVGTKDPQHGLVAELYLMARRSSRGGEDLLDRMLAEIEGRN